MNKQTEEIVEDKRKHNKKVTLDLVGINGNAFALMGVFQRQARREKWTQNEIDFVLDKCQNGDYDNLVGTLVMHTESPEQEDEFDDEED